MNTDKLKPSSGEIHLVNFASTVGTEIKKTLEHLGNCGGDYGDMTIGAVIE